MEVLFKIIAIGLITCFTVMLVRPVRNDFAIIISIVGGILILIFTINYLTDIFSVFNAIINKTGINKDLFTIILKIIGIGYLTEFSASICSECGSNGLADKIKLGGKVVILIMAVPIMTNILDIVMEILP